MSNETSAAVAANTSAAVAANKPPAPPGISPPAVADSSPQETGKIIPINDTITSSRPIWLDDKDNIIETELADYLCRKYNLACMNGVIISKDGVVDVHALKKCIVDIIRPYVTSGVARKVDSILSCLRIRAYQPDKSTDGTTIFFKNGQYVVGGSGFTSEKELTDSRLPVAYNPQAPKPERFLQFMHELLFDEDIPAIQEYLGYCFLKNNTKAQKMCLIMGTPGIGKSRLGTLMETLMGQACTPGKISMLEANRFALASLEHKLLMIEDDLKLESLPSTDVLKTLVTASGKIMVEQKNQPAHPAQLYARILAFGNGMLTASNDHTSAFSRRQLILKTRPKPENRVDDPDIDAKLAAEAEGIILWMIEGAERLVANHYQFTLSEGIKKNLEELEEEQDTVQLFLNSDWVSYDCNTSEATKTLLDAYYAFCHANSYEPLKKKSFQNQMSAHSAAFNIHSEKNIRLGGHVVRGYRGIKVADSRSAKQSTITYMADDDGLGKTLDEEMRALDDSIDEDDLESFLANY